MSKAFEKSKTAMSIYLTFCCAFELDPERYTYIVTYDLPDLKPC